MLTEDVYKAGLCIRKGGLVIFPTETVYGIGASALNQEACHAVYRVKNRPSDNPLIVHLASVDQIASLCEVDDTYAPLIRHFLPGPLTLIFKKKDPALFTSGLDTVAIRIPQLELARALIAAAGVPVAAPSANLSGRPSITRCVDAVEQFADKVDMILQGPDCSLGIESTVVDLSGPIPVYLRPGSVSIEELQPFLPGIVKATDSPGKKVISPGMKYRHYAPECRVVILEDMRLVEDAPHSGQIGFQLAQNAQVNIKVGNNSEYTRMLYAFFIDCDRRGLKTAYCEYPQAGSLQEALYHRLLKAACK